MMEKKLRYQNMYKHFSKISLNFSKLRTTDDEPIQFIKNSLNLPYILVAEVGCGDGRYSLKLFECLKNRLYLYCIDNNLEMLNCLQKNLAGHNIRRFTTRQASAGTLPFYSKSLNCVITFNAVHHFDLHQFLKDATRVLKKNGSLFIYTRTREQNSKNIWGKYFPFFNEKETRLYELDELREAVDNVSELKMNQIKFFKFPRTSSIKRLEEQAKNAHYSTFELFSKDLFDKSLKEFKQNLKNHFDDSQNIHWFDENLMLVLRKD